MSWQVSNAQWLQWVEEDATAPRTRWVSCDDFDEGLRQRLELQPFLATSENTIVGRSEETMATMPPGGGAGGDAFDSMATVVRMAPEGLRALEPEAAQTLVHGTLEPYSEADEEMPAGSGGLAVSVEGGGYQVELETKTASSPVTVPTRSGQTLRTEPVPIEGGAAVPVDVPGLFIPALTRSVAQQQAEPWEQAQEPVRAHEHATQVEPEQAWPEQAWPEQAQPEQAWPEQAQPEQAQPGLTELHEQVEPLEPAPPHEPASSAAAVPGLVEPVSPSSSGTMVVLPPHPGELTAPAQSGRTVIVQQTVDSPIRTTQPPVDATVIAPATMGPPVAEIAPQAQDSQTAGVIEPADTTSVGDAETLEPAPGDKVVVDSPVAARVVSPTDSDAIDATDIVEEAEVVEEAVAAVSPDAEAPAPPAPPPAPVRDDPAPPVAESVAASPAEPSRKPASRKVAGWYDEVFAEHFASLRRRGLGKTAKAEVEFFLQTSGIGPGTAILDVGCGDGAHSITLAQRGFRVTSMDNASAQLSRATAAAQQLGVAIDFQFGDMRDMDLGRKFDGIVCLGTTFGYFDDDVNRHVLRRLRDHLELDGRMLLQVFNRDYVAPRLPSRSWWQGHGCLVLDEAQMNYFTNRLHVHRTVVFEDGRQFEHDIHVRSYGAYELGRMCVGAGLRVVEISGSRHTRSRFYGATSPEIWLLVGRT